MTKPNGLHHLAVSTGDIKQQIAFFSDVLGMELVALYWMHGVEGAWHGFMKLNDHASVAFVQTPAMAAIQPVMGVSHAGTPAYASAPGTMQHLALNVDDDEALITMRDRIRSRGVNVIGPIDHGMCKSIYFAGPELLCLEISTSAEAINPKAWIDPQVVALAGITASELEDYITPPAYAGEGGAVAQPPYDPAKPHQQYPHDAYLRMLAMPDDIFAARTSITEPPVKVA